MISQIILFSSHITQNTKLRLFDTQCPEPDFVGCTAPDPFNPEDECPTVGEPCDTGNGEYCCLDACPRNFCTAKEGRNTGE
jgi:hypothetical protein